MFKNIIISALATKVLFDISPYTFSGFDIVIMAVAAFAAFMVVISQTEETIRSHTSYKARRKFRRWIRMTTVK